MELETVKVKRDCPRGYKIINKDDFDPERHELFDQSFSEKEPAKRGRKPKGGE